ncbi:MAG: SRPBCC family protein [Propionibacteriaceae bacterium]|jgi:uncharacterized protein YndB with AHSA1/START domain|nr:SRPBCC family protein [Propionibacteriaceae bacterium]
MELSFSLVISAKPESVWPFLVDVGLRRQWETDLEDLAYDNGPALGATGVMKLADMPPMPFKLVAYSEQHSIADQVEIPGGATLTFSHEITATPETTLLTQAVRLDKAAPTLEDVEFLAGVFSGTPEAAWRLKALAEQ